LRTKPLGAWKSYSAATKKSSTITGTPKPFA
jgi:hypothetical protein